MTQSALDLQTNPSEEDIRVGPLMIRFLLTGKNSTGSISAFEMTVPAAQQLPAPAHSHNDYEETIYGVEGVVTFTVDGRQIDIGPGQALCIPRGAVHRFDNRSERTARVLCMITPAIIGPEYFRETGAVVNATAGGPPDRAKLGEIMRRYGLTPAPPQA